MNEHTRIDQSSVDQHVLDLLNGSIDGELSAAQQAELDELLAGSDHVRGLYQELKALVEILGEAPEREPPAYLHDAITSQVRVPVADSPRAKEPGLISQWLAAPWMRTGLALAAGVVLTVGIYKTGSENLSPEDASSMTGTVVKDPNGVLLDSTLFSAKTMNAKAVLRSTDDFLVVDVYLESNGVAVVNVDFSGQGLEYISINGLQNQAGELVDDVTATNGSVSVTSSGRQHYELLLKQTIKNQEVEPAPLVLEFFTDNVLVHKAELGSAH